MGGVAATPKQANRMIARGYLGWHLLLFARGIAAGFDGIKR